MVSVRLKTINEGLDPDLDLLSEQISSQLAADNIIINEDADVTLKIKFMIDNDQEITLLQLRETDSKVKLGEKVIHFVKAHWLDDAINEAHALVASLIHEQAL